MAFEIFNRRYTGSKNKLVPWIKEVIGKECPNCTSFCDIFAGTAVVTHGVLDLFESFTINDFLYSNEIIYNAFFGSKSYNDEKIHKIAKKYRYLDLNTLEEDYVTREFGNKYFSCDDAKKIDFIRNDLEKRKDSLNKREYDILLASLLYSLDRSANTVGHYDAYIKKPGIRNCFNYELIKPLSLCGKKIKIFREDANTLATKVKADVVYIDPPYSSRQYSRFYHVLETITKWEKPELFGEALKPAPENVSEYSKSKAIDYFEELIVDLKAKFILVSYNNTYASKSKSSKNKMTLEDIQRVLEKKGSTRILSIKHKAFNSGKTEFNDHKEMLFITKVGVFNE